MNHLLHSTDLFECYCWQKYTAVSNTDLYLSYFDLSYIFPGHNDSVEWGPTIIYKNSNACVIIMHWIFLEFSGMLRFFLVYSNYVKLETFAFYVKTMHEKCSPQFPIKFCEIYYEVSSHFVDNLWKIYPLNNFKRSED